MSTRGNLQDMSIASLIQNNCQDQKTARLTIQHDGSSASLYFQRGNVVHATLGDAEGEEVVYNILAWEEGNFDLETGVPPPATTIRKSWSSLLLEGARRLDESQLLETEAPTERNIFREVKSMELDNVLKEMGEQTEGFIAAAVVGMDGMNIASYSRNKKADTEAISAQMTVLLKLVDTAVTKLGSGVIEDDLLTTESSFILMRFLKDRGFYLGMSADRKTAKLGSMRLNSRIYADRIAKAMPR